MKLITEKRIVSCGESIIAYELTRKSVKNINIRIKPDGRVLVSASSSVPIAYIDELIRTRQEFILRALKKYQERQQQPHRLPHQYVDGESFSILGKRYVLNVMSGYPETVKMNGQHIILTTRTPDSMNHKERLMTAWLRAMKETVFTEICRQIYPLFQAYNVQYPVIKMRQMKARWGSCQPYSGVITLNSRLIETPRECIEYVVLHEFVHFIHPNHSKKFYELVADLMPDWKERKQKLEKWA